MVLHPKPPFSTVIAVVKVDELAAIRRQSRELKPGQASTTYSLTQETGQTTS
jgi:hypothetical protein